MPIEVEPWSHLHAGGCPMTTLLTPEELTHLEKEVLSALRRGGSPNLDVLGFGQMSLLLRVEAQSGTYVCKRSPSFVARSRLNIYSDGIGQYTRALQDGGVSVVDTTVQAAYSKAGGLVAYSIQPLLPPETLGPAYLASLDDGAAIRVLQGIVRRAERCVSDKVGIDGRLSSWALYKGNLRYVALSRPWIRDEAGEEIFDRRILFSTFPVWARDFISTRLLPDWPGRHYELRTVLLDLLASLHKAGLERHISVLLPSLDAAEPPITEEEVREHHKTQSRTWLALRWLRWVDRLWLKWIKKKPYPFLLPGRSDHKS